jgi:Na+/serine symporter
MPKTLRKLIGVVLIIALVLIYALVATTVAAATLGAAHWSVHLLYFLVTGLLWILPAMAIIKWMERPDRPKA